MGLTPETVTQRRISLSQGQAMFSTPEGSFSSKAPFVDTQPRREILVQEKVARKACATFLLIGRRLAQFGSSIVDFNGLPLIDQPYSLRDSGVPPRRTLDRLYSELLEEADILPNERQRVHLRANIRAASSWCDLVEGVYSGIPQDFQSQLAAQYDFPNTLRAITPFPQEIINASVKKLRSIVRDAAFGGFSPDERGRAGIMRRHEGMRIFPLSYWNIIAEQTQQMQQIPKDKNQLPQELKAILHWGFDKCRNDIIRKSDKVIGALNKFLDVKIAGVGVTFSEEYEDDYWTCRTSQITGGTFQLKLNTRRLLYIHMGRVEHLGGHELACHFGAVMARVARYNQLSRAGSHLEDTDMYLPDLINMLPSPQQVMEEGLAEMYSKFLPEVQQVTPEDRMAQDFTLNELIASHGLYYNAQLLMEQAGDDQEARNAVKREQAKNIAEELMVSRREAYDELNYRDYRAFATPRDIVRAWRAALYRPAYAMGVLLMELARSAFSALPPDEYLEAKRQYINYLVTRGTTPELMIEKAAELSGGKLNPETARRCLYS